MNRLALALALSVLPALGGGSPLQSDSITLYTAFQQAPPAAVVEAIRKELDDIMLPAGLRFDWHPLAEARGRVSTQLAVVHFKGECDAEGLRPEGGYPGPLGWTHITDGEILPFIDIDCDGVRLFVERDLAVQPQPGRDPAIGRALARILAHELYHYLASTRKHAGKGIAKAVFSPEDLLARTLLFGEKEYLALGTRGGKLLAQSTGLAQSDKP